MNYGEEVKLTKSEKLLHSYKVLCKWLSAREQFHLGQLYNSKHGIHMGEKIWRNQQYSALKVYKKLVVNQKKFWKTFWRGQVVWRILKQNI